MLAFETDYFRYELLEELIICQTPKWKFHSQHVSDLSALLARHIGCSENVVQCVHLGSLLHDIGKQFIPDSILDKPGKLSPDEFNVVRLHPWLGYEYLYQFVSDAGLLNAVLYHHERWNGSGYPYGLEQREIPIEARICAIVDVWDALTSDRCYRNAWNLSNALDLISTGRGTLFDPDLVLPFIELIEEHMTNIAITQNQESSMGVPSNVIYT